MQKGMCDSSACLKVHCEQNLSSPIPAIWTRWFSFIYTHTLDSVTGLVRLVLFSGQKPTFWKEYLSLTPPYGEFLECRKPKFELVKNTFNVKNFIRRLYWSICSDFGTIRSWNVCHSPKSPKKSIKPLFWHSRSSKVTDFGGNRMPVSDLVINSNLGPILHHFWDTVTYWLKIEKFRYPSCLSFSLRMTPFKFLKQLYRSWN